MLLFGTWSVILAPAPGQLGSVYVHNQAAGLKNFNQKQLQHFLSKLY